MRWCANMAGAMLTGAAGGLALDLHAPTRMHMRRRAVAKEFKGKEIEKGIAVPTCIAINK